ncbi:MAG: hypothetical protein D3909_02375 [Candidatus Electrothrix sp. ATG1]|nr:hypothetical protein [Candidatus Electrothrix sp. ATG1]
MYRYEAGPFLSLIEQLMPDKPPLTVIHQEHTEFVHKGSVMQIDDKGLWIQLIHGENSSNSMRGKPIISVKIFDEFSAVQLNGVDFFPTLFSFFRFWYEGAKKIVK